MRIYDKPVASIVLKGGKPGFTSHQNQNTTNPLQLAEQSVPSTLSVMQISMPSMEIQEDSLKIKADLPNNTTVHF